MLPNSCLADISSPLSSVQWVQLKNLFPQRIGQGSMGGKLHEARHRINEAPSGIERYWKITVVGTGASGINFAKF